MSKIGYIRVSTQDQETARQEELMKSIGADRIFCEKISGKNTDRPEYQKMMEYVREGDVLYIESISRLSRSVRDLLKIVDILTEKGVEIVSAKEKIDTSTPQGRFVLSVFAALSELEREQTLERQREGIAIAKANGKYKGRKPDRYDNEQFDRLFGQWSDGKITAKEFQNRMKMSRTTFYRRIREHSFSDKAV